MTCGHDPNNVTPRNECRECSREYQRRYRRRVKLAMALLHSAENRGLSGYAAVALLQNADPMTIEACQAEGIR